jgi:2-iminobutanoate/2-iminopropanoate deaminase
VTRIERPYALVREHVPTGAVFVSGAAGLDAEDRPVLDPVAAVDAAFDVLAARLASVGLGLEHVHVVGCYLRDIATRDAVDEQFRVRFSDPRPARKVVAVRELPLGALVLVDATAYRPR